MQVWTGLFRMHNCMSTYLWAPLVCAACQVVGLWKWVSEWREKKRKQWFHTVDSRSVCTNLGPGNNSLKSVYVSRQIWALSVHFKDGCHTPTKSCHYGGCSGLKRTTWNWWFSENKCEQDDGGAQFIFLKVWPHKLVQNLIGGASAALRTLMI